MGPDAMERGDVQIGAVIKGRYRLLEPIGGGGMGHVFRAEDVSTGRVVAVKLLHRDLAQSADVAARLFHEARVVSRIRHPNIIQILEADTSELGPYIVMELLDGRSVGSLLGILGRFDEPSMLAVVIPVLAALDAAHRAGVIHRDLKPENIFVCREQTHAGDRGSVHLLDFGIAKLETPVGDAPRTRTGIVFGTPDYLSPEQATGEGVLDGRSDLFSLGVVLFELLTGRRPFTAGTAVATAFRIVHGSPPSLESMGVSVSAEVRAVLRKLLEKDPAQRPESAAEVVRVLEALDPDEDARDARLLHLLELADERKRRSTRPPGLSRSGHPTQVGLGSELPPTVGVRRVTDPQHPPARLARGPVLRSLDAALEREHGDLSRERVVALLSDAQAEELRRGRPSALDAHDLDVVRRYADLASRVLGIDRDGFRGLGKRAVDGELAPFVATIVRPAELPDVLRRAVAILRCLFDFGTWEVASSSPSRGEVRVKGYEAMPALLRAWLLGVFEAVVGRAVGRAVAVHDRSPGASEPGALTFEVLVG